MLLLLERIKTMNKFKISPASLALRCSISSRKLNYLRTCMLLLIVLGLTLIHAPSPSAAPSTARAPQVRLVFTDHFEEGSSDGRWDIKTLGRASIQTEEGKLEYEYTIPDPIEPGGSPCKLTAKATAKKGARLNAFIELDGAVDFQSPSGVSRIDVTGEADGQTKTASITITLIPRSYSEGATPLVRVKMKGGHPDGLVKVLRYAVQ
jgi:hypothetical protein